MRTLRPALHPNFTHVIVKPHDGARPTARLVKKSGIFELDTMNKQWQEHVAVLPELQALASDTSLMVCMAIMWCGIYIYISQGASFLLSALFMGVWR